MNLESTKIELVKLILSLENPQVINKLADLIKSETMDFWDEISEEEKKEIIQGIKQLDQGKRTEFKDFMDQVT